MKTQTAKKKDRQLGLTILSVVLVILFTLQLSGYLHRRAQFINDRRAAIDASIRLIEAGREKELVRRLGRLQSQHPGNIAKYYRVELEALEQQRRTR